MQTAIHMTRLGGSPSTHAMIFTRDSINKSDVSQMRMSIIRPWLLFHSYTGSTTPKTNHPNKYLPTTCHPTQLRKSLHAANHSRSLFHLPSPLSPATRRNIPQRRPSPRFLQRPPRLLTPRKRHDILPSHPLCRCRKRYSSESHLPHLPHKLGHSTQRHLRTTLKRHARLPSHRPPLPPLPDRFRRRRRPRCSSTRHNTPNPNTTPSHACSMAQHHH